MSTGNFWLCLFKLISWDNLSCKYLKILSLLWSHQSLVIILIILMLPPFIFFIWYEDFLFRPNWRLLLFHRFRLSCRILSRGITHIVIWWYFPCTHHLFKIECFIFYFSRFNLQLFFRIDGWKIVLDHVILPVLNCTITLNLLGLEVNILYVHSRIVRKIPECDFYKFFSEKFFCWVSICSRILKHILLRLLPPHWYFRLITTRSTTWHKIIVALVIIIKRLLRNLIH